MAFPNIRESCLWRKATTPILSVGEKKDLRSLLEQFAEKALIHLREIRVTFPEYTPHDDTHIERLFEIAEIVLGEDCINSLNPTEAFLLSCSLFGHDIGMAVSKDERNCILSDTNESVGPDGNPVSFAPISGESDRFDTFLKEHLIEKPSVDEDLETKQWAEYIRLTHAERSGERIKKIFQEFGAPEIGRVVADICVAHGMDAKHLRYDHLYPTSKRLHSEVVNVQATAIYLRIIDLLDLCQNRTPYEQWRFINPKDKISAREWKKHHALEPIFYEDDEIVFRGSTSEVEVWSELHDLREYCQAQYNECRDLLKSYSRESYHFRARSLQWKIEAKGFVPTLVKFSFNEKRVVEMLGASIYGEDRFVFLREIIQNSIDALRTRKALIQSSATPLSDVAVIQLELANSTEGETFIKIVDSGIGMDLYTLTNYFSVAGNSFYQSDTFNSHKLEFDPISRFGIGFLASVRVAKKIEITTRPDPYCYPSGDAAYKVTIFDEHSFWHISKLDDHKSVDIGTCINITLSEDTFPEISRSDNLPGNSLDALVQEYVENVFGWPEFPISLKTNLSKTLIIHPSRSQDELLSLEFPDFDFHALSASYPFEKVFEPQDVSIAKEALQEVSYNFEEFDLPGLEGFISYLIPREGYAVHRDRSWNKFAVNLRDNQKSRLRLNSQTFGSNHNEFRPKGPSSSARLHNLYSTYRDGVLIPEKRLPKELEQHSQNSLGWPLLRLNVKGKQGTNINSINLSRTQLIGELSKSLDQVLRKHSQRVATIQADEILALDLADRFEKLELLHRFCFIRFKDFCEVFPMARWPIAVLTQPGKIEFREWETLKHSQKIPKAPQLVDITCTQAVAKYLETRNPTHLQLVHFLWGGPDSILELRSDGVSSQWFGAVATAPISGDKFSKVGHLSFPPYFPMPPLRVEMLEQKPEGHEELPWNHELKSITDYVYANGEHLSNDDLLSLANARLRINDFRKCFCSQADRADFPAGFADFTFIGSLRINTRSAFGRVIHSQVEALFEKIGKTEADTATAGLAVDKLGEYRNRLSAYQDTRIVDCEDFTLKTRELLVELNCITNLENPSVFESIQITPHDFLPGPFFPHSENSIAVLYFDYQRFPWEELGGNGFVRLPEFGRPLSNDSVWPLIDDLDSSEPKT